MMLWNEKLRDDAKRVYDKNFLIVLCLLKVARKILVEILVIQFAFQRLNISIHSLRCKL